MYMRPEILQCTVSTVQSYTNNLTGIFIIDISLRDRIKSPMNIVYTVVHRIPEYHDSQRFSVRLLKNCTPISVSGFTALWWVVCQSYCILHFVLFYLLYRSDTLTNRQIIRYTRKHRFSVLDYIQYVCFVFVF